MKVNAPDWNLIRSLPAVNGLNIRIEYWLASGLETAEGITTFYEHRKATRDVLKTQVNAAQNVWMRQIIVKRSDLTDDDIDRYAQATRNVPRSYLADTKPHSTVNLEIPEWSAAQFISVDAREWLLALERKKSDFGVAQERGDLVQGVYRQRDQLFIVSGEHDTSQFVGGIDGVQLRAALLEHQLRVALKVIAADSKKFSQKGTQAHG